MAQKMYSNSVATMMSMMVVTGVDLKGQVREFGEFR
jgi:hypothetical protein